MAQTHRQWCAPKIAQIIKDNEGKSLKELKKILSDANPGPYGNHKKVWANEYMSQLGLGKKKSVFIESENQNKLF